MTDYNQVPTLYIFGIAGLLCGLAALIFSIASFVTLKRNQRQLNAALRFGQELKAGQLQQSAENAKKKSYLEKTLRELEHDHDKFKDTLDGYAQSLARIESVVRAISDTQQSYLIKNNTGISKNNIKVSSPNTPDPYMTALLHRITNQPPPMPEACKTCNLK